VAAREGGGLRATREGTDHLWGVSPPPSGCIWGGRKSPQIQAAGGRATTLRFGGGCEACEPPQIQAGGGRGATPRFGVAHKFEILYFLSLSFFLS
jgi:hypothetical protein